MSQKPCIVDIFAIVGGPESHLLTEMLLNMFIHWAGREGFATDVLERAPAFGGGLKFAKLQISGADPAALSALHHGVHSMIRTPPDDLNRRRHMSVAGIRIGTDAAAPLPEDRTGWGEERRRYIFDPNPAVSDTRLGRFEIDPAILFAGDFSMFGSSAAGDAG
jgi:hypothetical protein